MIFDGKPDNLHWIWDTGLLQHINRKEAALAAELEEHITAQDRAAWTQGSIEDWVLVLAEPDLGLRLPGFDRTGAAGIS